MDELQHWFGEQLPGSRRPSRSRARAGPRSGATSARSRPTATPPSSASALKHLQPDGRRARDGAGAGRRPDRRPPHRHLRAPRAVGGTRQRHADDCARRFVPQPVVGRMPPNFARTSKAPIRFNGTRVLRARCSKALTRPLDAADADGPLSSTARHRGCSSRIPRSVLRARFEDKPLDRLPADRAPDRGAGRGDARGHEPAPRRGRRPPAPHRTTASPGSSRSRRSP